MLSTNMIDTTLAMLNRALQYGYARQNVIAHNIANANTPQYKTLDLLADFESKTQQFKPFYVLYTGVTNLDGNNVNVELESLKSMYTTLYTQTILDFMRSKYDRLKSAISERVV